VGRGARGIRFDVHHGGGEAGRFGDRDAVLDLFAARRRQHDFHVFRRIRRRADDVEVQADLVQRERDVLAGLGFDLHFELVFGQAGGQDDFLGDDGGRRHAERDVLDLVPLFFQTRSTASDTASMFSMLPSTTVPRGSGSDA
jgi:hypothetical protein